MKYIKSYLLLLMTAICFAACSSSEDTTEPTAAPKLSETEVNVESEATFYSVTVTSRALWNATVENGSDWLKLTSGQGVGGTEKLSFEMTKNTSKEPRVANIKVTSGTASTNLKVTQAPSAIEIMEASQIKDYNKYYCPGSWNPGFEKGPEHMLRNDAKWSWFRSAQSEHFFVFWDAYFGDDPNSSDLAEGDRVDIQDLLQKAEQFYKTNIERLKMATLGQGKSMLDDYKMEIYLLDPTPEWWVATGSGYDNMIGALWVTPATCKPVGSTIAHEIGHSFQYQVSCDRLKAGTGHETDYGMDCGFRYGFGQNGAGGCAYWEQCAQWQSFQDYPEECFTQEVHPTVWLRNHHRHFNHEFMRYASYWLPYYLTQKHGIEAYGRIWQESQFPEDPLETYARLFCNGDMEKFYDEYYDYAAHCVNYDFDAVHQYLSKNPDAAGYATNMLQTADGFQPTYDNCPGTTGFNAIALNIPAAGTTVKADLKAIAPGSALADGDQGKVVDGDGNSKGTVKTYNKQSNTSSAYRIGFVAITGDKAVYGEMAKGKDAVAEMEVPAGTTKLYLVVVATPTDYQRQGWDDDETNDAQWPYSVKFEGTAVQGFIDIPTGDPEDVAFSHDVKGDAAFEGYQVESIDMMGLGYMELMAKAFKLQPAEILTKIAPREGDKVVPAEGNIALGLTQPDGTISFTCSTNAIGPWINADGMAQDWANGQLYFEYDASSYNLPVGFKPGTVEAGKSYTMKPTWVYTKGGKQYKAVMTVNMQF